jgi:uncharacterized protein
MGKREKERPGSVRGVSGPNDLIVGLDLAGSPRRPTGACRLSGRRAETRLLCSDDEILNYILENKPVLIAVDAPLTLPPGRTSIHDRNDSHYRACDLELRKRKIPFFPITLGPMRSLTERGMILADEFIREGIRVIEIYPGGGQDIWGIPRAARDHAGLVRGLRRLGLLGLSIKASAHELDAATGALVGRLFLEGNAEIYGDFIAGAIVMPR